MKMEILDKHFISLPQKSKMFVVGVGVAFFLIALYGLCSGLTTVIESFLLFVIGLLYAELLKLEYRINKLEKKKSK